MSDEEHIEDNSDDEVDDAEEGASNFEVEYIISAKAVEDKREEDKAKGDKKKYPGWSYFVKWAGYTEAENTWEHETQFDHNTERLLRSFWKEIGIKDYKNYEYGTVFHAPDHWIEKEKKYFAQGGPDDDEEVEPKKARGKPGKVSKQTTASKGKGKGPAVSKTSQPQLKTKRANDKTATRTSKSVSRNPETDSDAPAEPLAKASSRSKSKRKSATGKAGSKPKSDSEEEVITNDTPTTKTTVKRPRTRLVPSDDEEIDDDTAYNRRNALKAAVPSKPIPVKPGAKAALNVAGPSRSIDPSSAISKGKKVFIAPARLWNSAASKNTTSTSANPGPEEGGGEYQDPQVSVDNAASVDLFGDPIATEKPPAPKRWRDNKIKFYDPTASQVHESVDTEGNAPKPIATKQRILAQLQNTDDVAGDGSRYANLSLKKRGPTDDDMQNDDDGVFAYASDDSLDVSITNLAPGPSGSANTDAELPDYDEDANPLPVAPVTSTGVEELTERAAAPPPVAGAHPTIPPRSVVPKVDYSKLETSKKVDVDLTGMEVDGPQIVDLMDSELDEQQSQDSDIVIMDVDNERSALPNADDPAQLFAVLVTAGEEIAGVKLAQQSRLRNLAPKLTFLCRSQRLNLLSFYPESFILPMLSEAKVLQTGLLLFTSTGVERQSSRFLFENFVHNMHDFRRIALVDLEQTNERKTRVLLLFHSTALEVAKLCQVPPWNSRDGLIIASVELSEMAIWPLPIEVIEAVPDGEGAEGPPRELACVQHAINKLKFPKVVLETEMKGKIYSIIPDPSVQDPFLKQDVQSLGDSLEHFGASYRHLAGIADEEAFIFIHRKALRDFGHQLPQLIRLRPYIRLYFYMFGLGDPLKGDDVHQDEVLQMSERGGIVTFTPQAVLEDPTGVVQLADDLNNRLGWQCYVIPSVLAALQEFKNPENDKHTWALIALMMSATKEENRLILTESLERVLERLRAKEQPALGDEPAEQLRAKTAYLWTYGQFELLEADPTKLLDLCRAVATQNSPNINMEAVDKDVFDDMASMQRQPKLAQSYRRFVVITSTAREGQDAYQNELDCCTVAEFLGSAAPEFAREKELMSKGSPSPSGNMDIDDS